MRRQATIISSTVPDSEPVAAGAGKKKKKSKYGTADGKHPFGGDDMESRLATICKERPKKKEVLQYYRDRIAELVAAEEY